MKMGKESKEKGTMMRIDKRSLERLHQMKLPIKKRYSSLESCADVLKRLLKKNWELFACPGLSSFLWISLFWALQRIDTVTCMKMNSMVIW